MFSGGLQPVRDVFRALALQLMDGGQGTNEVGHNLGLPAKAARQIGKRVSAILKAVWNEPYSRLRGRVNRRS